MKSLPPLTSLPESNVKDIKDWARNIANHISSEPWIGDRVWANLRILLSPKAKKESIDTEILWAILRLMRVKRDHIINLLWEKECIKRLVGVQYIKPKGRINQKQQARQKQRRTNAAEMVLQEIEGKIQLHMSHIPATDD